MIPAENKDSREQGLLQWLKDDCRLHPTAILPMLGDASTRRYFRIYQGSQSYVAMDASMPFQNCFAFAAIANALRSRGVKTPEIIAVNLDKGYLLLTNFGESTFLSVLSTSNADDLYDRALDALSVLQGCREVSGLSIPVFTEELMWQEWTSHKEWFLDKLLGVTFAEEEEGLDHCYKQIVELAVSQPQVFMHRDYHSANLMYLTDGSVGVLDFQDAFMGPLTYDVVSLLRDCYIDWEEEKVQKWVLNYWRKLKTIGLLSEVDQQTFLHWFDWMGVERHIKALFTFARKQVRDHQPRYLESVPRTLNYLLQTTKRYPELHALYDYFNRIVQPAFYKVIA